MIKLSDLAEYCSSIKIDCDKCEKQATCKRMVNYIEIQSPVGVVKAVKEDMEF